MNKRLLMVLLSFFPILAFADDGTNLTFAPPASDYSVVFLGNLFGAVDGVLHSSGSQIMGAIFTVFNSAVLALGGIVIMYTLMVSTMNTAHEGQMLGQKWSSIWIPLRSTLGLGLLIPKASGYCLMQIFVMWVVVQGVGAADKVWQAALSYLNRGGVIIQAEPNPGLSLLDQANGKALALPNGAFTILVGQVCMLGLQKQLEIQRTIDQGSAGRCKDIDKQINVPAGLTALCTESIPNFLSSVNFVTYQGSNPPPALDSKGNYNMPMPNFTTGSYVALNGTCGVVTWKPMQNLPAGPSGSNTTVGMGTNKETGAAIWSGLGAKTTTTDTVTLTSSEYETAQLSRAIALQQMYSDLSLVAQTMVDNNPSFNSNTSTTPATNSCTAYALQQYGIPYTANGSTCLSANSNDSSCTTWGPDPAYSSCGGALFNGTEFAGAIQDYNGVIQPTLRLIATIQTTQHGANSRSFIADANAQGWMMAGAYFFDLVKLNGNATSESAQNGSGFDTESGLDNSTTTDPTVSTVSSTTIGKLYNSFVSAALNGQSRVKLIANLIQGSPEATKPTFTSTQQTLNAQTDSKSISVYGFVDNSLMVRPAGQPGAYNQLKFADVLNVNVNPENQYLKPMTFSCGNVKTFMFSFCLGALLGDLFYNAVVLVIFNLFIAIFGQIIQQLVMAFIMIPLQALAQIFQAGLAMISQPGANPIVALANMGVYYINFAGNLWLMILGIMIAISIFGPVVLALLMLVAPLFLAWLGIMVSIGFTTAYYIPILPYMIFTFGSIAWLISVIEAMVAAPIVALGVTHPEGHDAFGKGEAAIMLLMNVFLRPAMMIIGYISGIALSYVSVWVLNAGFEHAISFVQAPGEKPSAAQVLLPQVQHNSDYGNSLTGGTSGGSGTGGYSDWAGIFAFFFSILVYTTMYITLVQKAFTLISYLPDKVLRWIGGSPESLGGESAQWGDEMVKGKMGEASKATQDAQGQMNKQMGAHAQKAIGSLRKKMNEGASSGEVTASSGDEGGGGGGGGGGGAKPPGGSAPQGGSPPPGGAAPPGGGGGPVPKPL
ncbi:type IVB secretion system protein DotA [Legionella sp. km772]|uniref:type IVB secretion system protein DotA n=1 Tax=Legionella sp. km772 TaxID=2498111 RepID=UPI000F8C459C|nr:type IVB secretion system protein DotA [Legionella sp. km772]RUR13665.1 type IV secretion protein DotA [Legionella sp. km772]